MKTKLLLPILITLLIYLFAWPVAVEPVSWAAPINKGFTGAFEANQKLANLELSSLHGHEGPEAIVVDQQGTLYTASHDGWILKNTDGKWTEWVNTQGRPLGLAIDQQGNLIAADAYRGLLKITQNKVITVLSDSVNGTHIKYANDLDIANDGTIYFTDSSTKFGAEENGGTYPASLLDLNEHGAHGRLLQYTPSTKETNVLLEGINFANGVALDPKGRFVLINETGHYRVLKYWLTGKNKGNLETLIENLPGFPDNLSTGLEGRFWLGLPSPRNVILDKLADSPNLRKIIQRLPAFVRPKAVAYGHVVAFDESGNILMSLQDPEGAYPITTGVFETESALYISSLMAGSVGKLDKARLK